MLVAQAETASRTALRASSIIIWSRWGASTVSSTLARRGSSSSSFWFSSCFCFPCSPCDDDGPDLLLALILLATNCPVNDPGACNIAVVLTLWTITSKTTSKMSGTVRPYKCPVESSPSSVEPPGTSTTRKDDAAAVTTTASDCDMRETRPTVCERRRAAPAAPLLWTPIPPIHVPLPLLLSVRFSRAERLDRRRLSTRLLYDAATFWSSLRGNIVRDVLLVRTDPAWTVVLVLVLSLLPHADGVSPPPPTRSSARPQTARTGSDRLKAADTAGLIRRERDSSELSGLDLFRRSSEGALASHQMLESSSPSSPSLLPPPTFRMFTPPPPPPLLFFVFLAAAAASCATRSCAWATANTSDENRRGKPADRAAHRSRVLLVLSCSSDRLSSAVATAELSRAAKARRTASCC
mmetsp:Transcript_9594/g.22605  ORF Transcript_9594/g.22605 Transcript_9594/m.22605 type:complete len:409 (-) Transcript_9594:129-1355(-)